MHCSLKTSDRLARLLRASGLEQAQNGRWGRKGTRAEWEIAHPPEGWLTLSHPSPFSSCQGYLELHSDWAGPVKLTETEDRLEQRWEFFVARSALGEDDASRDESALQDSENLLRELVSLALGADAKPACTNWQPPEAKVLAGWLTEAGHEVAIDRDQHLRLTLKRPGCDGQVRIERGEGRLRFLLPLGQLCGLSETATQALDELARLANASYRLVRIVMQAADTQRRYEARVDLSGLPFALESSGETLWREMVSRSVRGLELALRQLGLELPLLAEPVHHDLAQLVKARTVSCR
jgi:hypothetical protein